ncbi:hypothetical protein [Nonomuraea soli]|uniref:DUF1109 domain-containing protein n=1 Tax=Nonomuraea soli TaxID=1032476 RepID=A0A7W0CRH4_9ACTN|nr:hypothetical protein [Nonomuraea soli]MBA2895981.1 hypothetical protein [Nonomuraea soli]
MHGESLLSRPPGLVFTGLVGASAALTLYGASVPGGIPGVQNTAAFLSFVLAVTWIVRMAGSRRGPARALPGRWVIPMIAVVTMGLMMADAPLKTRFLLSESALRQQAHQMAGKLFVVNTYQRLGLFNVSKVVPVDDGVLLRTRDGDHVDHGFAWMPEGPMGFGRGYDNDGYEHLIGDWYVWTKY